MFLHSVKNVGIFRMGLWPSNYLIEDVALCAQVCVKIGAQFASDAKRPQEVKVLSFDILPHCEEGGEPSV